MRIEVVGMWLTRSCIPVVSLWVLGGYAAVVGALSFEERVL